MSRTLQWVIGICVVGVSLAIVFAVFVSWMASWFGWGPSYGMMGAYAAGPLASGRYGRMGGGTGQGMMGGGSGYGMMGGGTGQGMMGGGTGYGMMGGSGMMPWTGSSPNRSSAARLSMDQARTIAEDYAASAGTDFVVAEMMEFQSNFYAAVKESSTGRGAFELLIDPYTGGVGAERGPNMMWNSKYGHMSFGAGSENRLSMEEARASAQQALGSQIPGATVHEDGTSFYGYYTFDYDGTDGVIAGMLSVDGNGGGVWLHTWHGDFISEWEAEAATS